VDRAWRYSGDEARRAVSAGRPAGVRGTRRDGADGERLFRTDSFIEARRAWLQRSDDLYDQETYGTIALSRQGCAYHWLLVVSGPERGVVWDDSRACDVPLSPLNGPSGQRLTFGQWYLGWLIQTEAAVAADRA